MSLDENLPPGNCDDWSDDVLNAWLPRGVVFNNTEVLPLAIHIDVPYSPSIEPIF